MDEKRALSIIKKIKGKVNALKALTAVLVIAALFLPIHFLLRILIALLIGIALTILQSKIRESSLKILTDECDPETYYAVVHGVYRKESTIFCDIQVASLIGDFEASAKAVSAQLSQKQNKLSEFQFTFLLAQNAFFAGDFETCADACEKAEPLLSALKVKEAYKQTYVRTLDFYKQYISGDYAAALNVLADSREKAPPKVTNSSKVMTEYYWAIAHYYNGDIDKAEKHFKAILDFSPKFFITEKAKQYMQAINAEV